MTIQLRLCETFLSLGRTKEAGESLLYIVDQEDNTTESIKTWVSGELLFFVFFRRI